MELQEGLHRKYRVKKQKKTNNRGRKSDLQQFSQQLSVAMDYSVHSGLPFGAVARTAPPVAELGHSFQLGQ